MVSLTTKDEVIKLSDFCAAKGFLCSESVLLAISDCLRVRSDLIPKIATGFGAGIGGQGEVCGAISGGIIALGIKYGRSEVKKQKIKPYWFASELLERFEKEFSHVTCQELTECDPTTEAGRKKYKDEKLWETKCRKYIETVAAIASDLISEGRPET